MNGYTLSKVDNHKIPKNFKKPFSEPQGQFKPNWVQAS